MLERQKNTPGKITFFNVGSCRGLSLLELIAIIQNVTGKHFKIDRQPDRGFNC